MSGTHFVGIDPGSRGGVAALREDGSVVLAASLHAEPQQMASQLGDLLARGDCEAIIENPPTQVGNERIQVEVRRHKLFRALGRVEGVLSCLLVPFVYVWPTTWQSRMLRGAPGADTKERALFVCRQRWPGLNLAASRGRGPHDGICDALMLAEYLRTRPMTLPLEAR